MMGSSSSRRGGKAAFGPGIGLGLGFGEPIGLGGPSGSASNATGPRTMKVKMEDDDVEVYSDQEDGVRIVDLNQVKELDPMAPDSLRKEQRETESKSKKKKKALLKGKGKETDTGGFRSLRLSGTCLLSPRYRTGF